MVLDVKKLFVNSSLVSLRLFVLSFLAYSASYGLRLPVFVPRYNSYSDVSLFGVPVGVKLLFAVAFILGYMVAKPVAITFVPRIQRHHRKGVLLLLLTASSAALLGFAVSRSVSSWLQALFLAVSAFHMSWVWAVMALYLEGRRWTDVLVVGIKLGIVFSTGVAKSVAALVLLLVSEQWMPFFCSVGSALLCFLFLHFLDAVPDASEEEVAARFPRQPLDLKTGQRMLLRWLPGIASVTAFYVLFTCVRYFRDMFSTEIYGAFLQQHQEDEALPSYLYTAIEVPAAIAAFVVFGSINAFTTSDRKAFLSILSAMLAVSTAVALVLWLWRVLRPSSSAANLLVLMGVSTAIWIGYMPPGGFLYDRFMGASEEGRTSTFFILFSDGIGYVGTLSLFVYFNFVGDVHGRSSDSSSPANFYLTFFLKLGIVAGGVGCLCTLVALLYFMKTLPLSREAALPSTAGGSLKQQSPSSAALEDDIELLPLEDASDSVSLDT